MCKIVSGGEFDDKTAAPLGEEDELLDIEVDVNSAYYFAERRRPFFSDLTQM